MAKQWHVEHAVITGGSAAFFARNGVTGPRYLLEGPQGVFAATCRSPDPLVLTQGWRIDEVSFKPWGACRHAHAAIDAALRLKEAGQLSGKVHVETYADAIAFCDKPDPRTVAEAKFSIQHAVAIVMARDVPTLDDFEPEAIDALAPIRAQISVAAHDEFTSAYPAHFGARVMCDAGSVTLADTLGDPERPLSQQGLIDKARMLMMWGELSSTNADHAVRVALEDEDGLGVIRLLEAWL